MLAAQQNETSRKQVGTPVICNLPGCCAFVSAIYKVCGWLAVMCGLPGNLTMVCVVSLAQRRLFHLLVFHWSILIVVLVL